MKAEASLKRLIFHHTHPSYITAGHHYERHNHSHHELVLIQQGQFRARVMDTDFVARRGDILLYTAGVYHEEWAEKRAPVLVWACGFSWDGFEPDEPILRRDTYGRVQELLAGAHCVKKSIGPHMCANALRALVAELERLKTTPPDSIVEQVRTYIRARIAERVTVEDLARVTGLSQAYFARRYRALAGRTPMEDVRFLRIEEARRLIMTTEMSLHEIAPQVGISTEYHLSRLLRTHLGVGVRELRTK